MTVSVSTPLNFSFTFIYCPNTDIFVSTPFLYHVSPDTGLTSRHTIPSVFCVTPTRILLHISKPYPKPNSSGAPSLSCSAFGSFHRRICSSSHRSSTPLLDQASPHRSPSMSLHDVRSGVTAVRSVLPDLKPSSLPIAASLTRDVTRGRVLAGEDRSRRLVNRSIHRTVSICHRRRRLCHRQSTRDLHPCRSRRRDHGVRSGRSSP
ncbi:hypothetical protein M6B38_139930 [Iris pallida]|uniref:Uncharacterized protein n=1 Tax=Iris pallida TaxID=29817 RepID=A0AAX6FDY2_IRIPA|nr:hypothetical protein M6B38_139930 [Iris pallida]